jgi:hypothetical protein
MELWDIYDAADDELLQELARLRQEGGYVHVVYTATRGAALALSKPGRLRVCAMFRRT